MSVEVIPVEGLPEFAAGDDLGLLLAAPLQGQHLRDGDIVVVTQKIVSKSEGKVVPGDRADWIERETRRVVARREDLLIAETRHGFVCANAGVDESNVPEGFVSLLPDDPDASAERIRSSLHTATAISVGVVVTDTFGRAWRSGVVNVAIGCAGLPALVDLRGTPDAEGRLLEATVIALADEVAAASGLVVGKADSVPAALVRGVRTWGASDGRGRDLVRPAEEDLFRESPLTSIAARRTIRSFASGPVPRELIQEAVRAAATAPAPHHTQPWAFVTVDSPVGRRTLLTAMASAWQRDLEDDGVRQSVISRRLTKSDALLAAAPALIVPVVRMRGAHAYPDAKRVEAERDMFILSAGAAIQNLLLALHAQGLASAWVSSTLFCKEETREALGLDEEWLPMGSVAVGRPPEGSPNPRPALDLSQLLESR